MSTPFEFDPEKSRANKERHGIDFIEAQELWEAAHVILPAKVVADEKRYFILGGLRGKIYLAVFVDRGGAIRLISCHRADPRLEKRYQREMHDEKTKTQEG